MHEVLVQGGEGANQAVDLHLLPCTIKYTGPAAVDSYFLPTEENEGVLSASFRGRLLKGRTLRLPPGYKGLVLSENSRKHEEEEEEDQPRGEASSGQQEWEISGSFDKFAYWNHDTQPSDNDTPPRWIEWLSLAEEIHKPVTEEELQRMG